MRKQALACLSLALLLSASLNPGAAREKGEPTYQGKPLSHWIAALKDKSPPARPQAMRAMRAIGEPAVPALRRLLCQRGQNLPGHATEDPSDGGRKAT